MAMTLYNIYRYYASNRKPSLIATGQTLEEVQRHCQDPKTRKTDKNGSVIWFDGYTKY